MKNRNSFTLDTRTTEWHQYHLGDALLRNDVSWRAWRYALQQHLTPQQLAAQACAICQTPVTPQKLFASDYLGGYHLLYCARPCQTPAEQSARRTIEDIENDLG
ncbi:MAG TPA: hypothetical protein VJ843_03410 [Candidatus Saccharimonadales bacterium]|nr:hypothetical protein [Candidatus Saccharimonadales bacterium]